MMYMILTVCLLILTGATSATVANDFKSSCYTVNNHNYCFYTNGSVMNWTEARQFCAGINLTLPIIRDEDIDKVFQKFIVNDSYNVIQNNYVWIGARARPVNELSQWHWINGKQSDFTSTRTYWNAVISDESERHYVGLVDGSWTVNRGYICQYHSVTLVNESCSPQWKELPYTSDNSRSFTKHWTPKTLKQCQDMCLFNPRCVAVIWPPCYIYTSLGTSNRDVRYNTYKLVKRCDITSETSCDDGYVHKSTCYKIHRQKVRWFTAVNRCLSNNASLAVFDEGFSFFTTDLVPTEGLWVGLIKSWWTWADADDSDVLYNRFNVDYLTTGSLPMHPDDHYHCAVADKDWKVVRCSGRKQVVCQKGPPKPTTTTTTTTEATTTTQGTTTSTSSESETSALIIGLNVNQGNCECLTATSATVVVVGVAVIFVVVIINVVVVGVLLKHRRSSSSSAERHNDHHLQHLSQPQQPQRDEDDDRSKDVVMESQPNVVYGQITANPESYQGHEKVKDKDNDAVVYSDLHTTNAGSHIVTPDDQMYANFRQ